MHTRHCPRHVFAAPPAHFSGVNVTRGRAERGLYAAERTQGMAKRGGRERTRASFAKREKGRCEKKGERKRERKKRGKRERDELEGWRLSCGSISLVGENLLPTNETSPSKSAPSPPLHLLSSVHHRLGRDPVHPPLVSIHSRSYHERRGCALFFRGKRGILSSNHRWSYG